MPKEAITLGAVDDVVSIDEVARSILNFDARG
jgi:chemotaxis response regulator CheB